MSQLSEAPDILLYERESVNTETNSVVPTRQAEASRAIVGDNTVSENYAFVGVHYIFDQVMHLNWIVLEIRNITNFICMQHSSAVTLVKFANNDRSRLCCVSNDATITICNVTSIPPSVEATLKAHTKAVTGNI